MDEQDKRLLNAIQAEFPLTTRPFKDLGERAGLGEAETLARLAEFKRQRIIRQIGGIFDTRSLGYQSSLVAMRVPPERLDAAAQTVNGHPGVSHNYQRNHAFNLWFTLAVPPSSDLPWTVDRLHELAGAESTRVLPTLRLFKIGVQLDMEGTSGIERTNAGAAYNEARRPVAGSAGLRAIDIAVIRELQEDVPLIPEPYGPMAARIGMPEAEVLAAAVRLRGQGYLRRMAGVLRHREAGFRANVMGVWVVPAERVDAAGQTMGSFNGVSHCYLRPTYPDWPYNIFSMIHGRTTEDCEAVVGAISRATGIAEYALLYSTREFKKVRLRYFTPEVEEWETRVRHSMAAPDALASATQPS
jgi:DNA-binding Lrp family transcriptional regulator